MRGNDRQDPTLASDRQVQHQSIARRLGASRNTVKKSWRDEFRSMGAPLPSRQARFITRITFAMSFSHQARKGGPTHGAKERTQMTLNLHAELIHGFMFNETQALDDIPST